MPVFQTTKWVAHSADNMLKLVADVERYPEFLPLCQNLNILSRQRDGDTEELLAEMSVAYKVVEESFTSRVNIDHANRQIVAQYIDGPFKELHNRWSFADQSGGCEIDFFIDYTFRSRPLQFLLGSVFDKAVRKYTDAFEERANLIYGHS
ncbi:MAG: type II toxin-antitoxin system RatA family toxin [Methyloligellaceae bacterium]